MPVEVPEKNLPDELMNCKLLTPNQVMKMMGIGKTTLYGILQRKNDAIPSIKIGKSRRFRLDKLLWWIDKHEE